MSRTVEPAARQPITTYPILLLVVAFCLVVQFLVEDVALHRVLDASAQSRSTAEQAVDEMEHQDDLALAVHLPESIPHNDPPTVTAWSIRLERQPAFPIHIPPKIA